MTAPRRTDQATATERRPAPAAGRAHAAVAIPRAWLVALILALVLPWLIVAAVWTRSADVASEPSSPGTPPAGAAREAAAGPWGRLTVRPIIVSPPLEYVAADWGRGGGDSAWHFPGVSREMLEAFLTTAGFSREQIARLQAAARPEPRTGGLVISPDPSLVRGLTPELRARLYGQLAKSTLNADQVSSQRFYGSSADAWLAGSSISPKTRQLIQPLIYHDGQYLNFADAALVQAEIPDPLERQRLAKVLLRQSTMLVNLTIDDPATVPALAEYWGRGGRATDVRPLLESVATATPEHSIDIVHLLPSFVRNRLYRYPKLTTADLDKPLLANCLWTSLNFFRTEVEDRYLDVNFAFETLRKDYYIVENSFRLGDIVALVDDQGSMFHVAVYLADDLVFTKNGTSPVSPWIIMPLDRLKAFYAHRTPNPRLIYHRRNDL